MPFDRVGDQIGAGRQVVTAPPQAGSALLAHELLLFTLVPVLLCAGGILLPWAKANEMGSPPCFSLPAVHFSLLLCNSSSHSDPSGSSVLIFCSSCTCPPFPPQTPLPVKLCCCLTKLLLLLPYGALRLQQAWKALLSPKVPTSSVKQSNASALELIMALTKIPPGGLPIENVFL